MATIDLGLLHIVHFADLTRWSAPDATMGKIKSKFPLVPLSAVLRRIKEPISIEDGVLYKRITVRNNGRGVVQRDELHGREIGTKRQFIAHAGQLIISRIDARNGAFGIVPKELEGAIVTNDFWLFEVHDALPEYLMLVLSSERFQQYWQSQSSGTTNRQRISADNFITAEVAFPPIHRQEQLVDEYKRSILRANSIVKSSSAKEEEIFEYLKTKLAINDLENPQGHGLLQTTKLSNMVKWSVIENFTVVNPKLLFVSRKYKNVQLNSIAMINPRVVFPSNMPDDKVTFLPMECVSDIYGEIVERREGHVSDSAGYTRFREGDILWAKITPCMQNGKCAVARHLTNGCGYGSTEFHVVRAKEGIVLPEYVYCFLRSSRLRQAAKSFFSGSAGQQRVGADFIASLTIPLIPIDSENASDISQKALITQVMHMKKEIKRLRQMAESMQISAKQKFESVVFD